MGNPNVGIDISMFQATVPEGPWLFVVHKATEGHSFQDPKFAERFPTFTGLRGAYHYARPGESDGADQANHFADTVLAAGFKPNVDMWQLDCEDGENAGVAWQPFIADFMAVAIQRLGNRGFLYAGYPFVQAHGLSQAVSDYHWWLPDYSVNDGNVHNPQVPSAFQPLVILQQFTSAGNLDQNVVRNAATWKAITQPVDYNAIAKVLAWVRALRIAPLKFGQRGPAVQFLNSLLVKQGYYVAGTAYGEHTRSAVAALKAKWQTVNRQGEVVGRPFALRLLRGK